MAANTAEALNNRNHLRPGRKATFSGTDSDYRKRNGEVTIVRELIVGVEVDEECAPMYRVRDEAGDFDAFEDELTAIPLAFSTDGSCKVSGFYRLKPEHDGREYPWPCGSQPNRTIQIFADDILTKVATDAPPPMEPGTMMKHTGLGCFGIRIPDEHMDRYSGWPRMSMNGSQYGSYEQPQKIEPESSPDRSAER